MSNNETTVTTLDDEQQDGASSKAAPRKQAKPRQDSSVTTLDDEPDELDTDKPRAETLRVADHGNHMSGDKMELTLHAGEGDIGRQAVFLSINGHGFNIPRSIPVIVPEEVIEILDNATMTVYERVGDKMVPRDVKRFAYNARSLARARAKGKS
jgi:hypothetical protein